jgi:rifampicin phosphotransferase
MIESQLSTGVKISPHAIVGSSWPLTIPLDRLKSEDAPSVGGKGAHLGALLAGGLPVPAGFCVTTEAYRQFAGSCRGLAPLCDLLATLGHGNCDEARRLGGEIRQRLADWPLPPSVEEAIVAAWRKLGESRAYAVRSSATAEDQPDASFAGQAETFLNIRGREAVLRSVRACWLSFFADRAIFYRMHNRVDPAIAEMAVVVQELITPEVSGVLFTADPVSGGTGRIVIEATYGLGQSLVSGEVSPDRFVLSRPELQVIECRVGSKATEVVPDGSTCIRRAVDSRRATAACMNASLARQLGLLALEAERLLGGPQDLEWAVSGGRIFLLQSRSITSLPRPRPCGQSIWSNMNSWEVLPGALTPMSWSVSRFQLHCLFAPLLEILGIDIEQQPIFGLIAGRAYANLNTLARVLRTVPGLDRLDFVEALGGQQGELLNELIRQEAAGDRRSAIRDAVRCLRFAIWAVAHGADQQSGRVLADFRCSLDKRTAAGLAAMSETELLRHLDGLLALLERYGPDAAGSVTVAMVFVRLYFNFVKGRTKDASGTIANRMLRGLSGLASADAGVELGRLAAWARNQPRLPSILENSPDVAALPASFAETASGAEFLARWHEFMKRHGHHAFGEMDVHNPRWSESPAQVLDILRGYLSGQAGDPEESQRRLVRQRRALASEFRRQFCNPLQGELFDFLFRKARMGIALRENVRNEIVRLLAAVRSTLRELGERFTRRGLLAAADDIFFVELSELRSLASGVELGGKIAARKTLFACQQKMSPPPVVMGDFDPRKSIPHEGCPSTRMLHGLAASTGVAVGRARVMLDPQHGQLLPGEILVAPYTDPGWTLFFRTAAGIVMDVGGILSHGSIVAREYGIPAVVNVGSATRLITSGQVVRVDGDRGLVTVLSG